ncbi:MAG: hypothetical protein K5930_13180 [Treponemataceae bacterium]|nr:hypothetical protein [Treponemataceae bacterium]
MKTAISWTFLLYFLVLMAERAQSIIRVITSGQGLFISGFSGYVNTLTIISLIATIILLIGFNGGFWHSLFSSNVQVNVNLLCITAGVLLLSGMVHTEFTIPGIQFAAYGSLILGLILQTVLSAHSGGSLFKLWYSLAFLVVFSMAIPVMYQSAIKQAALFHVIEAFTAAALVAIFTFMMMRVMNGQAENLLLWIPFLVMLMPDAVIIAMRWKESVNTFVLIFASLSTALFIIGKIIFALLRPR